MTMKSHDLKISARAQLTLLLLGVVILVALSFLPTSRAAIGSSETRFSEASVHGLNIIPASCASDPQYFHTALPVSGDGLGYISDPGTTEYGAFDANAGEYVCVTNGTGSSYFIPGNTAGELNAFKASPGGVTAY